MRSHRSTRNANSRRAFFRKVGLGALALAAGGGSGRTWAQFETGNVVVFAAASLKGALDEAVALWSGEAGRKVVLSYGGSPAIARQIEQGAPAHVFISADLAWMDWAEQRKLIESGTRVSLLGNRLVLVAPQASALSAVPIEKGLDLASLLGQERLALGKTQSVPAGRYGMAALQSLGAWEGVASRLAETENVRAALQLVVRGEAPLGIVYRTDAQAEPGVKVVGLFPEDSHPPIVYPAAATRGAPPAALKLLEFLGSAPAHAVFERHGFTTGARAGRS
jgi:molybdate transport system substrate-binding protein